ncbi:MAG: glycosyltransferase family 2 protein [Solirubrobacterales bacterium]
MSIQVILPVLNERDAIPGVLGAMPSGYEPLVVDNNSSDGSGDLARELGATVVRETRPGFGAACWRGLASSRTEIVCFMDCDGSLDPRELDRVAGPVRDDEADLVLGARDPERGAWPLHARLLNRALALAISRRVDGVTDIGPMRAARRAGLLELELADRRFGWPLEMVLRAAGEGWRIEQVPVTYAARSGRSKVTGTLKGTARTIYDMTKAMR